MTSPPPGEQRTDPFIHRHQVEELETALLSIDRIQTSTIIRDTCSSGSAVQCVESLIVPALEEIGNKWERGEASLSQVYMSGRICEAIVDTMVPDSDPARSGHPRIAIAVLEDHHALGKRIVYSVLRAGGYTVTDYGLGLTVDQLVDNVVRDRIQILLISTLMLPPALRTKEAIARIRKLMPATRIIVGGAPFLFDPGLWREVGADAMGHAASETLEIVRSMVAEVQQ
jgi:trimethylamine corrinoid protein